MGQVLLIDRPSGITSFGVVARVRRALRVRKAGHAGTLDPMATGLLIIATDSETKRLADYLKLPKTYEAKILLGQRTDTGDVTGRILEEKKIEGSIEIGEIREALRGMVGDIELQVPAYSAVRQGGKRLYELARKGRPVDPPKRTMKVFRAELLHASHTAPHTSTPYIEVLFNVGSGTYIRSLAEELGRRLGYPATLAGLRRTKIGEFRIEDAHTLEGLVNKAENTLE
jgi:tRNA pseudouridine55 synthase